MEDGGSQSQQNSHSNTSSESILSDNPDATSQQITATPSDSQLSQSQPSPFHGITLGSAQRSYKTLSHEDCLMMVSGSIKSVLMNTFNDAFRKQCYELLKVDSSEEAGQQFLKLLEEIVKPNENNSSTSSELMVLPTDSLNSSDSVDIFSSNDNIWAIPPTPITGSPCASQCFPETSENPDFASFGNDFEVEKTTTDPCSGLDYYALAESINEILTQSEASQLPNVSQIPSQNSPNHEVLADVDNQNIDVDQPSPPGSPSLLQNINDSETMITHDKEQVSIAIADDPSQNGQKLTESQQSQDKWATPIQLEGNTENQAESDSHTPENLEVKEKDLSNPSNQELAEEVVFVDTDHLAQGKQKKMRRHASRESELGSKGPLQQIQNTLHLAPQTPTRENLLQSFRSIRP